MSAASAAPAAAEHAAFLAQLQVLQQAIREAETSSPAPSAGASSPSPPPGVAVVPPPLTAPQPAAAALSTEPEAPRAHTPAAALPSAAQASPPRPPSSVASSSDATGGAGGRGLLQRGLSGMTHVLGAGKRTATTAITSAHQLAAPAARRAAQSLGATKEAAVDRALTIALERGLRNAGHHFVQMVSDDEDMPACARARARSLGNWVWAELEREVLASVLYEGTYAARHARAKQMEALEASASALGWWPSPVAKARASVLYALYPYDRSVWGQLRMPLFYPLLLLCVCPVYGVQPVAFFLLFLLRDKGDEFQLVQFILEFKGLQFVTVGALSGLIAGARAQWCSTHGTCARMGLQGAPGMHRTFYLELGLFTLNVLLVWAAFVLLPLSKRKGALFGSLQPDAAERGGARPAAEPAERAAGAEPAPAEPTKPAAGAGGVAAAARARAGASAQAAGARVGGLVGLGSTGRSLQYLLEPADDVEAQRSCCGCVAFHPARGGALRSLLIYDLLVFVLVCVLGVVVSVTTDGWERRSWLYWCRVLYGLGSLPFALFVLPPFDRILVHAKPTYYDQMGRCVPPLSLSDRQLLQELRAARAAGETSQAGAGAGAGGDCGAGGAASIAEAAVTPAGAVAPSPSGSKQAPAVMSQPSPASAAGPSSSAPPPML